MTIDWNKIRHFKPSEFDDPEAPGSHVHQDAATVYALDNLRHKTGWPIVTHNRFGLRGCVCVRPAGHSTGSLHYVENGASAVDFHFATQAAPRAQAMAVLGSGFAGVGIYYDWHWAGRRLAIGFHVDQRHRPQIWKRIDGEYIYFLV